MKEQRTDSIASEYERMHKMSLHYENLLYSSTSPIFTLCLTLSGIIISQDHFQISVRLLAGVGGLFVSVLTLLQISTLRRRIIVLSEMMNSIEEQYSGIGFSQILYQKAREGKLRYIPTNMRLRFFIFSVFSVYFFAMVVFFGIEYLQYAL